MYLKFVSKISHFRVAFCLYFKTSMVYFTGRVTLRRGILAEFFEIFAVTCFDTFPLTTCVFNCFGEKQYYNKYICIPRPAARVGLRATHLSMK